MKRDLSLYMAVFYAMVMIGVIFGILTNSRNSIIIKEMAYVAGAAAAGLAGFFLMVTRKPSMSSRIPGHSLLALTGVLLLGLFRHHTGINSVNGPFTLTMLLSLSLLSAVMLLYVRAEHFRGLALFITALSFLVFVYALLQWQGLNLFHWDAALTRSGRSTGTMGNPNLLGGYASALVPLGATVILGLKGRSGILKTILSAAFAVSAVLAIVASGTRGSLIGLFAGASFMVVWFIIRKRPPLAVSAGIITAFLAMVALAAFPMATRLSELDPSEEDQGTLQVRKLIWSGAYGAFMQEPITGNGPGSFQIIYPEYRDPMYRDLGVSHNTLHAHCEYLEILVDGGIVALLLWGVFLFFVTKRLSGASPLRAAAFAGLAAMLAEALVSVHLRWPPTAFLFSFLLTVFLARETSAVRPGRLAFPSALLILASAAVCGWSFFTHYLPFSESSRQVFMGKDIYLNRTEASMQSAYQAAFMWQSTGDEGALQSAIYNWNAAEVYADSAVHFSTLGTETYPSDLGAWYALGSAHLTRHMIMKPPVTAMAVALEQAGLSGRFTQTEVDAELHDGMQAYEILQSMAPNYAEVHNNLALGYSSLGNLGKALEELYASYLLHGHRRVDYLSQAAALAPLRPSSPHGWLMMFTGNLPLYADPSSEGREEEILAGFSSMVSALYLDPAADPVQVTGLFRAAAQENLEGDKLQLVLDIIENTDGSYLMGWWSSSEFIELPPDERLVEYYERFRILSRNLSSFPGALPVEKAFYTAPLEYFLQTGFSLESFDVLMRIYLHQIFVDEYTDNAYVLSMNDRFRSSVDREVSTRLDSIRLAVGGSRAALRSSEPLPWKEGSLPELLLDTLRSLQGSDPLNPDWYEMEMKLEFLLLSTYWWEQQIFSQEQNSFLLNAIFQCRDRLMEVSPGSWQNRVYAVTGEVLDMGVSFTGGQISQPLELLRTDLFSGTERPPEPPL